MKISRRASKVTPSAASPPPADRIISHTSSSSAGSPAISRYALRSPNPTFPSPSLSITANASASTTPAPASPPPSTRSNSSNSTRPSRSASAAEIMDAMSSSESDAAPRPEEEEEEKKNLRSSRPILPSRSASRTSNAGRRPGGEPLRATEGEGSLRWGRPEGHMFGLIPQSALHRGKRGERSWCKSHSEGPKMGSEVASVIPGSLVQESFKQLERQQELISCCTVLWKELSDHFSSLEQGLESRSEALRSKRQSLDASTQRTLDSLRHRELSIGSAVDLALAKLEDRRVAAVEALAVASSKVEELDLSGKLRSLCTKMDFAGFFDFVVAKRKELELLRPELPVALADCIDPAKFVLDAISGVFPLDNRTVKSPNDLGWACVLILESLVPVLADPELGSTRPLVTRCIRERAEEMAKEWKEGLGQRGGFENVKPPDAHTFLQHVVTFGIMDKNDKNLYRRLVISFAWRRQMPKLAISLGLEDSMEDIIEELIDKGHQLDAINFAYEASLQGKFPPTSLIQSFLKDLKKSTSTSEETNACGQVVNNTSRKEQSAIRAAIKCIQDHKLESEFPLESLQKQLETLEKVKVEKKKPALSSPGSGSGPANKRTRANHGGPMPPAKAGRTTINACVSSFPAAPAYVRSPSAHATYPAPPSYPYDRPTGHAVYGSRSPPAIREPYGYPAEEVAHVPLGASYPSPPMSYPAYGAYHNCAFGGYNNGLAPGYQQAYYR